MPEAVLQTSFLNRTMVNSDRTGKKRCIVKVARIFLVQHTKIVKNIPNSQKIYQLAVASKI
jgi:hypothetical protein